MSTVLWFELGSIAAVSSLVKTYTKSWVTLSSSQQEVKASCFLRAIAASSQLPLKKGPSTFLITFQTAVESLFYARGAEKEEGDEVSVDLHPCVAARQGWASLAAQCSLHGLHLSALKDSFQP